MKSTALRSRMTLSSSPHSCVRYSSNWRLVTTSSSPPTVTIKKPSRRFDESRSSSTCTPRYQPSSGDDASSYADSQRKGQAELLHARAASGKWLAHGDRADGAKRGDA